MLLAISQSVKNLEQEYLVSIKITMLRKRPNPDLENH